MKGSELDGLAAVRWATVQEDIWAPAPYHVGELHEDAAQLIVNGIEEAVASPNAPGKNPKGIAIQGQKGTGKTHLLVWARQQIQQRGGYFFLTDVSKSAPFWQRLRTAIREGLRVRPDGEISQLQRFLGDLSGRAGMHSLATEITTGPTSPTRKQVDTLVEAVRSMDRIIGGETQDTLRALLLLTSRRQDDEDVALYYLAGGVIEARERKTWGFRSDSKDPSAIAADLFQLMSLSGPILIAFDQIDALIDEIHKATDPAKPSLELVTQLTGGLLELRRETRRTLTILSCLPESWDFISTHGVDTVVDRFLMARQLRNIPSADIAADLLTRRFSDAYTSVSFRPDYATWPIHPSALSGATRHTVRQFFERVERHFQSCLQDKEARELRTLDDWQEGDRKAPKHVPDEHMALLDATFADLRQASDVTAAFDPKTEDLAMPAVLAAGLDAWIAELGEAGSSFSQVAQRGAKPELHACLRQMINAETEDYRQWAFRAIGSDSARAVQTRLRDAVYEARPDPDGSKRRLFVLRNIKWPTGPKTDEERAAFTNSGGIAVPVTADDLKMFDALGTMLRNKHVSLDGWLQIRKPTRQTQLLNWALADALPTEAEETRLGSTASTEQIHDATAIPVGTTVGDGGRMSVSLAALRRHVAIFAGSGSGKTVLIRRIVEECALRGVSAVVLDPNSDLARLGQQWPEPPEGWSADDEARSDEYLASTDVVIWTPGREGGRPLTFRPLPDFTGLVDDIDTFRIAVQAAVDALMPRVNSNPSSKKGRREEAVLRETIQHFARESGTGLDDLVSLLEDLPDGVSRVTGSSQIASDVAQALTVAMVNDPLFGGRGQPLEPSVLLGPPASKRARVSIINFVGLSMEQQQSFINRMQMALFLWFKGNPSADRPLGALLVMDEAHNFAPATRKTPCTESTVLLASQARKFGLGLVFATQQPSGGLHNHISSNTSTQFFGRLNSNAQINAARSLAQAKGGDVPDIGHLQHGTFYLATDADGFRKVNTPMCLSHHPPSALTEDEVLSLARKKPEN